MAFDISSSSAARITGIGGYVPRNVMTNYDLERLVDTNDQWIVQRTGIKERRIAEEHEFTSHMAIAAIDDMLQRFAVKIEDVDMILVATHTPDLAFPSVACMLQAHFSIVQCGALDINATCAGFVYGLHLANSLISGGMHKKILVVGADSMSKITDYTDRSTCILFGDGAGAALVERDELSPAFIACHMGTDGSGGNYVYRTGLSQHFFDKLLDGGGKIVQNGKEVYRFAVQTVPQGIASLFEAASMQASDIDWFIPHSANLRIIESICEKSNIPIEKTLYSLENYGNTSAATIPLSLNLGLAEGKVKSGDTLLIYGFGGGLTHCGMLLRWQAVNSAR